MNVCLKYTVNYIFFLLSLSLSPSFLLLSRPISYCTRMSIVRQSFSSLSIVWLSLPLSHRLIHHQRPGALQYIYYIGYVVVIVVRDVKGVDGEEREREKEKSKVYYITQMYVFVLFLIITLFFFSFAFFLSYRYSS